MVVVKTLWVQQLRIKYTNTNLENLTRFGEKSLRARVQTANVCHLCISTHLILLPIFKFFLCILKFCLSKKKKLCYIYLTRQTLPRLFVPKEESEEVYQCSNINKYIIGHICIMFALNDYQNSPLIQRIWVNTSD